MGFMYQKVAPTTEQCFYDGPNPIMEYDGSGNLHRCHMPGQARTRQLSGATTGYSFGGVTNAESVRSKADATTSPAVTHHAGRCAASMYWQTARTINPYP